MTWIDVFGWLGAAMTFAAYSMRTMLPLRTAAIAANLAFILFGWLAGLTQILILHAALLPFNVYRLVELLKSLRQLRDARSAAYDFSWLRHLARPLSLDAGELLFRKGDAPTHLYLIDEGEVLIEEVGTTLGPGSIVGEIGFFTASRTRTASARCVSPCRLYAVDEAMFLSLHYQNPAFGLEIAKLITRRLRSQASLQSEN